MAVSARKSFAVRSFDPRLGIWVETEHCRKAEALRVARMVRGEAFRRTAGYNRYGVLTSLLLERVTR